MYSRGERMEGVPAVECPTTRPAEPAIRALEYGVLGPDGMGLESSLVETADESVGPALLDETTRGAGSYGSAAGSGRGAELDLVIPTLFPKDGSVTGVAMKQRSVAPAAEERMEFWNEEGADREEVELQAGFLTLTHCNRIVGSHKLGTASLGVTPTMERMAASILESKSSKVRRLATSSEMRAR